MNKKISFFKITLLASSILFTAITFGLAYMIIKDKGNSDNKDTTTTSSIKTSATNIPNIQNECKNFKRDDKYVIDINDNSIDEIESSFQKFLEKYKLKAYISNTPEIKSPYLEYTRISKNDDYEYLLYLLNVFIEEWSKYTPKFVSSSNLHGIAFVKDIYNSGFSIGAFPDNTSMTLYFDIEYYKKVGKETYFRHNIHHEYYHLIEFNRYNDFYYNDTTWLSFNPPNFSYFGKGIDAYSDDNYRGTIHPYEGFISEYSMYAQEEDRSEVFACIMNSFCYTQLKEFLKTDFFLRKKVYYIKKIFYESDNKLNEIYFECINNTDIDIYKKY